MHTQTACTLRVKDKLLPIDLIFMLKFNTQYMIHSMHKDRSLDY